MTPTSTLDIVETIVRSGSMLAVVLGLLVLVLYLMKRFMRGRAAASGSGEARSVAAYYFSPRERIEVVEIDGERLVVGVGANGLSYMTTLRPKGHRADDDAES